MENGSMSDKFHVCRFEGIPFWYYIVRQPHDSYDPEYLWKDGSVQSYVCPLYCLEPIKFGYWETEKEALEFLNQWEEENN